MPDLVVELVPGRRERIGVLQGERVVLSSAQLTAAGAGPVPPEVLLKPLKVRRDQLAGVTWYLETDIARADPLGRTPI